MKKTLKAALSILLVLALLTALPLTTMAEGNLTQEGMPEGGYSENNEPSVIVDSGVTVGQNYGQDVTNNGYITTNYGRDVTNNGTIGTNYGRDVTNNDTVVNNGPYHTYHPTIKENNGTVENNNGPDTDTNSENTYGGIVEKNNDGGKVLNNGGTVADNFGYVGNNDGGTVTRNKNGGVVDNNGGTVGTNESGGVVNNESGTVTSNASAGNGEGTVGVTNNGGTVETNEVGGVVDNLKGEVHTNKGTVIYNGIEGTVNNEENGTVKYNLGTVEDTDGKTYYGLHGWYKDEDGVDTKRLLGSYEAGAEIDLDQKVAGITREGFKLTKYEIQVYKDGQLSDYTPNEEAVARANVDAGDGDGGGDGEGGAAKPLYRISAPTLLKLYWEQIVSIFKPAASSGGGAEAVPTSYNPKYIGLGSVIFINEKGYKVVEIKDDAFVVVSYDALSDEDVQDLDALFAKLFTAEQQKLIKNIGQLLDSEDVLTVFGKPGNHPVFEISKALVE